LVRGTDYAQLTPEDRVAQLSNASFDALTFEVWGALLNGAALVGIDRDTALDPAALVPALRTGGVTAAFLTTALFNEVAREAPDGFRTLRHLLFGGEAADPASVRRVLRAGPPQRLLNVYGPTESTTFATWLQVEDLPEDAAGVPIGRPVANTTAYVLDGGLRPCAVGQPGELFLGGDGVAHGYLGRPALTAERFVPDAFAREPGARLYRTGDRVRWREDGTLEFLGRADQQVKVRGFRIEPGEIEAALRQHGGVGDAVVVVRADGADKRLVAYVTAKNGARPQAAALRDSLRGRLPDYMVPGAFVALDSIPLTPSGKVDRRALPRPEAGAEPGAEHVAPRTVVEEMVAETWAEVLGREGVGVTADFFAMGGHSLLATQVMARLAETFEVEVPLRDFFREPTIEALARAVEAAGSPVLAEMVAELEGLSDAEIEALLR
ncbi:MAG TPA: non-ribosomal peptide synthetase, partial [Longimicrobium sp.]|nr:non-ribosomal peptide synthetase [Longimicrobium sp.]